MAYNLLFTYTASGTNPSWVRVNTGTASESTLLDMVAFAPKSAVPHGGYLYCAAGNTLYRYDPATNALTALGQTSDTSIYCGFAAPDGVLWFGTFDSGGVCSYDSATDTFTDHGPMDAEGPVYQYAYSIGADENYCYVQLGQTPWYLGVLNRSTGVKTLYFKDEGAGTGGVQIGVDGTLWFGNYKLVDGEPISGQVKPEVIPWYWAPGSNWEVTTWAEEIGYEVNLDDAVPVTNKSATIFWRAVGAPEWNEYEASTLPMAPATVHRVYPFDATRLLCLTYGYGPVFLYTVATGDIEVLGFTSRSLYDAVTVGGKWYFSGYPAITMEWDPTQPWTLTGSSADRTATNPRDVLLVAKYHMYSAIGSDGRVFIAIHHERDSVGGELGWFDPTDDSTDTQRVGLETLDPRGLAAVGDKIVYSGLDLEGGDGQLLVFDVSDPTTIERSIVPLADLEYTSPGYIVSVSATDVVGLAGLVAYRQNVVTGAQVWRVDLPEQAMGNIATVSRRAEVAPDGLIYFYMGSSIYRISPDTGTLKKVVNDSTQGAIMWHEGTAYLYGQTNLRRLVLPA